MVKHNFNGCGRIAFRPTEFKFSQTLKNFKLIQICISNNPLVIRRFCYYLGGTKDAATGILGEMSKPLSWGMPVEKVGSADLIWTAFEISVESII